MGNYEKEARCNVYYVIVEAIGMEYNFIYNLKSIR